MLTEHLSRIPKDSGIPSQSAEGEVDCTHMTQLPSVPETLHRAGRRHAPSLSQSCPSDKGLL